MGSTGSQAPGRSAEKVSPYRITPEDRRALIHRIARSPEFEKSTRLREFLFYVCERAMREPTAETHEQEIGHAVFGRDADYDTSQDNIVRVTASQARKKLERYFASEGAFEPVVIEIPKGGYTPVFHEREAKAEEATVSLPEPELLVRPAVPRRLILILAASAPLLAIVAIVCGVEWWGLRRAAGTDARATPALNALWSRLLPAAGRTDIVVSDSSFSYFQQLLDHPLTLSDYLNPNLWAKSLPPNGGREEFLLRQARQRFTSIASVTLAYRIARLAGNDQGHVSIRSPRDFDIRQMKEDNVVLLGSTRANPWVELIEDRLSFHFGFNQELRQPYFENRQPRPGELKLYQTDGNVSYCQVAFVPNLGGTGNILAISGTEVGGTEGGSEFVTNESSVAQLRQLARPEHKGPFPYFEVLLKSSQFAGTARAMTIVAFRLVRP